MIAERKIYSVSGFQSAERGACGLHVRFARVVVYVIARYDDNVGILPLHLLYVLEKLIAAESRAHVRVGKLHYANVARLLVGVYRVTRYLNVVRQNPSNR